MICFELDPCEVTWSSVKSFCDLYKQTQALLLSPDFLCDTMSRVGIATHFLGIFTVCEFDFVI